MKKILLIIVAFSIMISCAPPQMPLINNSLRIKTDYEKTWIAAVSYFAENNFPIQNADKETGFIVSAKFPITNEQAGQWLKCGDMGLFSKQEWYMIFNIFVLKNEHTDSINISVNCQFSALSSVGRASTDISCYSKGNFEPAVLEFIKGKLSQ